MTPEKFKEIRKGLKLTQPQLAGLLGYKDSSWMVVSRYERGDRNIDTKTELAMKALAAGIRPD